MKQTSLLISMCLLLTSSIFFAQDTFDIDFSNPNKESICSSCLTTLNHKPKEIQYSIERDGKDLFFVVNDKKWFETLFQNSFDGIAIDVVEKERYDCVLYKIIEKQIKGTLLKPMYKQGLFQGLKPFETDMYRVKVGQIPNDLINAELEYNILFLSKKVLCRYQIISKVQTYPWDLLDMGMFLDSLTYSNRKIEPKSKEVFLVNNKTIVFKIPFEKNKSSYSQQDIQPIYDSLRLTDYHIKSINIKAYASVEGSLERNLTLQNERANSISKAIQAFQKPTIVTTISSAENWVEFYNDIKLTSHKNMESLSKEDIKAKLVGSLSKELEPMLQSHRKAILKLELEKKDAFTQFSGDELVKKFQLALNDETLDEAHKIQNSIFKKVSFLEISPDYLNKMQIPKQLKYADLIKNNASFRYLLDERNSMMVYHEFLDLEKLVPKDVSVKYNITALKIKLWQYKALEIDEVALKNQILNLKKLGISSGLVDRMMVNFHIIKAQILMEKKDYKNKDASITFIRNHYKNFHLSDFDYLSLAQFLGFYANLDMAIELLDKKSRSIDIDEDLLFYYLSLTLNNETLTQNSDYRIVLFNALNINQKRYCQMFNAKDNGGVTFQLLEDAYLRDVYCDHCD